MNSSRMMAARMRLKERYPFYSTALFAMQLHQHPLAPGCVVDESWRVVYSPEWTERPMELLESDLYHRLSHLLREHHRRFRMFPRDGIVFNIGADISVGESIAEEKLTIDPLNPTPEGFLLPPRRLPENLYALLQQLKPEPSRPFSICHSFDLAGQLFSLVADADGLEGLPAEQQFAVRRQTEIELIQAGRAPGTETGFKKIDVSKIDDSLIDWQNQLASLLGGTGDPFHGDGDLTFSIPNRKQAAYGEFRMPAMVFHPLRGALVLDTSGSIIQSTMMPKLLGEVQGVVRSSRIQDLTVFSVDVQVKIAQQVFDAADVRPIGGGGTDMGAGIRAILNSGTPYDVIIVLTDNDTNPWPVEAPPIPVIICITPGGRVDKPTPPYASVIVIPKID